MSKVMEAEKLLREAYVVWSNNEVSPDKIAASFDKAAKAAPKGDSIIARANANKAVMYFFEAEDANAKLQPKLLAKAAKAASIAAKDPSCLLGIYADAKIRLKLGKTTESEIDPIVNKVKTLKAITWDDHHAKLLNIHKEEGLAPKLVRLQEIVKIGAFKDDFRAHKALAKTAMREEDYELAVKHYARTLELEPRLLNSYHDMSKCYAALAVVDDVDTRKAYLEKEKKVIEGYREARAKAKLKPDEFGVSCFCSSLHELEEYEEYFQEAQRAVKLFGKKEAWPHVSLGMSYSHKEYSSEREKAKFEKLSKAEFKKAHKLKPGSPHTTVSEAYALANFGKAKEAVAKLNEAQILMQRPEAQKEAKDMPGVQDFVKEMLGERKQALIAKIKTLGEQKDVDAISVGGAEDDVSSALREDYNAQVTKSNAKAHELVRAGIDAVRGAGQVDKITTEAEVQYSYRGRLADGKSVILDVERGIAGLRADRDEAAYGYFSGFYQTFRAAYASATLAADDKFNLNLSNPVSKASTFLTLLPFGGDILASVVSGGAEAVVKGKIVDSLKDLFRVCTDFEFGPMVGRIALKVTYAKKPYLADQKVKVKTTFQKCKSALKKLVTDGAEKKFYPTPEEFEGHKDALAILKQIYQGDKGDLAAIPRASFPERLEKYSLEHTVGSHADAATEMFLTAMDTALAGAAYGFSE